MKWFVLFLLFPFCVAAQGVKLNQYDVFLKAQRVEMEPVTLLSSPAASLTVTFSSLSSDFFVQLKGSGWGAITIDEGDELVFRFTNDSAVAVKSVSIQTFEPGIPASTYKHQYRLTPLALQALSKFELQSLRKYSFKEFTDIAVPKEAAFRLQKPVALFLAEVKKAPSNKTLKKIDPKDVYSHVGDSVFFCSKIYNVRDAETVVVAMQPDSSQPIVEAIVSPEDRAKFGEGLEKAWLNKDVCVSGVITLRDGVPAIAIRRREQLTIVANPAAPAEKKAVGVNGTVPKTGKE